MAFLDLKKAFDHVPLQLIWYSLCKHGVPEQLIKWVQMLYINTNSHVRHATGESDNFLVKVGVHQGSALSPLLFILVMDSITKDLQWEIPWTLLYANNIMLNANTREELQEQVEVWQAHLSHFNLCLNMQKTKVCQNLSESRHCAIWNQAAGEKPVFLLPGLTPTV